MPKVVSIKSVQYGPQPKVWPSATFLESYNVKNNLYKIKKKTIPTSNLYKTNLNLNYTVEFDKTTYHVLKSLHLLGHKLSAILYTLVELPIAAWHC